MCKWRHFCHSVGCNLSWKKLRNGRLFWIIYKFRELGKWNGKIKFLEKCVENEVIPNFLKFCVPKIDNFSDQAVRGFQLRLLKTELNKARENKANLDARADSSKSELFQDLNENLLCSVAFNISLSIRKNRLEHKQRLDAKLKKLSLLQDSPLEDHNFDSIRILDNITNFYEGSPVLQPKTSNPRQIQKVHFLADIDKLVRMLPESWTDGE